MDAERTTAAAVAPAGPLPHATAPRALVPRRRVRLHGRPHIDLLRTAGALCRS
ncbi:putative leader peptide [Streptomyces sp. NPDC090306]|uniref:putative leader peptide n=1 Tax=unclassified Streptomyces TaxID=2593676 RepID=UPI0036EAA82E